MFRRAFALILLLSVSIVRAEPAPAWVLGIQEGYWQELSATNLPTDVADSVCVTDRIFTAWNGGAYVPTYGNKGSLFYYGGGHTDNWCSSVLSFDLETLTWEQFKESYPGPYSAPYPDGAFPDGSPNPPHTYDGLIYAESTDEFCVLMTERDLLNESDRVPEAYCIDIPTRTWRHAVTHNGSNHGNSWWDSDRDEMWWQPEYTSTSSTLQSWNPVTDVFTDHGFPFVWGSGNLDSVSTFHKKDGVPVMTSFRGTLKYTFEYNYVTGKWESVTNINKPSLSGQNVWEYSDSLDAMIAYSHYEEDGKVWKATRTAPRQWTWENLTDASSQIPYDESDIAVTGSYSKYQVVEYDDAAILVGTLYPNNFGVWAFRIPGGGSGYVGSTQYVSCYGECTLTTEDDCSISCEVTETPVVWKDDLHNLNIHSRYMSGYGEFVNNASEIDLSIIQTAGSHVDTEFDISGVCATLGVFICEDFEGALEGTIYPRSGETELIAYVENGELVLPVLSMTGADPAGHYRVTFDPIGEGDSVYFYYSRKEDENARDADPTGMKHFIMWRGASSCTDLELSQNQRYGAPMFAPYTACGGSDFTIHVPPYQYIYQYGSSSPDDNYGYPESYYCDYSDTFAGNYETCGTVNANKWDEFYFEVTIGTYGSANSRVVAWHRVRGETEWRRYINQEAATFNGSSGFHQLMLTAYMTGKTPSAHADAEVRFGELVMSTQPFMSALQ